MDILKVERELRAAFEVEGVDRWYIQLEYADYHDSGKLWFSIKDGWYLRVRDKQNRKLYHTAPVPREQILRICALLYFMHIEDQPVARSKANAILITDLGITHGGDLFSLSATKMVAYVEEHAELFDRYMQDLKYVIKKPGLLDREWSIQSLFTSAIVKLTFTST